MSIFTIFIIASDARLDLARSDEAIISPSTVGTICHDRPNRSLSQPHCSAEPPASSRAFQYLSDFGLILAVHDERHRVIERVQRPGAHRDEGLAEQNKLDDLHRPRWAAG
jgi:hypothetical protein